VLKDGSIAGKYPAAMLRTHGEMSLIGRVILFAQHADSAPAELPYARAL
jgi:hypothetical protein